MLRSVFCKHTLLISTSGWLNLPRVICSSSSLSSSDSKTSTATMMSQSKLPSPPVAKKVEHKMELFGDVRVDNYYWLRDDSRSDPEVLANLKQENDYFESAMSGIHNFIFTIQSFLWYLNLILFNLWLIVQKFEFCMSRSVEWDYKFWSLYLKTKLVLIPTYLVML